MKSLKLAILFFGLIFLIGCVQEVEPVKEGFTAPVADTPKPSPIPVPEVKLLISDLQISDLKETSVKISWKTNLAADGQVEYGLSGSYGFVSRKDIALKTAHSHTLSNLKDNTTYFFRINSNGIVSSPTVFKTLKKAVVIPSPVITKAPLLKSAVLSGNNYLVNIELGLGAAMPAGGFDTLINNADQGDNSKYSGLSRNIPNLDKSKKQCFKIKARYTQVNPIQNLISNELCVDGVAETVVLPKILTINEEVNETSISIYWELDLGSTGQIEYGITQGLGSFTIKENNYLTAHRQVVKNLKAGTTYYYKIHSMNSAGHAASMEIKSFKTKVMSIPAPKITNQLVDNKSQTSAQIYWELDQSSTGQIEYGTTTGLGTFSGKESNYLDAHRQTLQNLSAGTTYYYRIISTNIDGKTITSSIKNFKTLDKVVIGGGGNTNNGKCYPKSEVRQNNNYTFHDLGYNPPPYPVYLKPIKEPNFGNYVTRITGKEIYGFVNRRLRHDYSKTQSWNSDGTLLASSGSGGARRIFDGKTFKILGDANLARWSYTQPYVTYGTGDNELRSRILDPKTMKVTFKTVKRFSNYSKVSLPTAEDNWSSDDRIFALQARKPGSSDFWIVVYDRIQDKILGERNMKINFDASYSQKEIDSVAASQSGKYIVVQGKRAFPSYTGVHVYDLQMNFLRKVTNDGMHADLCIDADGDDVYVAVNEVVSYKLKNGARRMNAKGLLFNGHLSCRNTKRPGWAYTTTNIFLNNQYGKEKAPGQGEIIAVKLDGSNTIQRFTKFYTQKKDYNHEVQGTVNHDGTRVLFASNWRESDIVNDAYPPMFIAEAACD